MYIVSNSSKSQNLSVYASGPQGTLHCVAGTTRWMTSESCLSIFNFFLNDKWVMSFNMNAGQHSRQEVAEPNVPWLTQGVWLWNIFDVTGSLSVLCALRPGWCRKNTSWLFIFFSYEYITFIGPNLSKESMDQLSINWKLHDLKQECLYHESMPYGRNTLVRLALLITKKKLILAFLTLLLYTLFYPSCWSTKSPVWALPVFINAVWTLSGSWTLPICRMSMTRLCSSTTDKASLCASTSTLEKWKTLLRLVCTLSKF